MLKNLLSKLQTGEEITLSYIPNQYGEDVRNEVLAFEGGQWRLSYINCHSSQMLGLGTCQCHSHDPYGENIIPRKEAMKLLKNYIAGQEKDEQNRLQEIAWLEQAISETS